MKLLLLVFHCLLPLAWPRSYLITTDDTTKNSWNENTVDEDGSDYTVDEDGSEYTVDEDGSEYSDDNDEVEESKPTKTICEQFSESLPEICKKIEDGTIKKRGNDYIGGLEAPWRRDILRMEDILRWQPEEDHRLVSARVDKSSR